jgi:dienelactone hydrolase
MTGRIGRREVLLGGGLGVAMTRMGEGAAAGQVTASPASRRAELYGLLGDLPDRRRPVGGVKTGETSNDGYVLETWQLDLNGVEAVPAYVARPAGASGRRPAVVFNHSHGGGYTIGKKEFVEGRSYLQPVPYAKALTDVGCVAVAVDHWVFGERSHTSEGDMFKAMLWQGQVLWGMMVYDSLRVVDWLIGRPDVDATRLATLGISMGSTMAWWLAALDERIRVTVDICCLTDFHTLLAKKDLSAHGVYYYVPRLLKHFTTAQINALIAPRAHLALAGLKDKLTPVEGLDRIEAELNRVYADAGHPDRWVLKRYDVGHMETPEGRAEVLRFLEKHL